MLVKFDFQANATMDFFSFQPAKKRTAGWKIGDERFKGVIHSKRPKTEKEVHDLLKALGVSDLERVSTCLKAAIINGYVLLLPPKEDPLGLFGLDQVVREGRCLNYSCKRTVTCRIKDIMYQPDRGADYSDGGPGATLRCTDECPGIYLTRLCLGTPHFENGKFHNHCKEHSCFGYCIGDYENRHCSKCGGHWSGSQGCSCYSLDSDDDDLSSDEIGSCYSDSD